MSKTALHSLQDPAFSADVQRLRDLARSLADQLDLLIDTAPADLAPAPRGALQAAAMLAARTLDVLAHLVDPATRPAPGVADMVTTTHTRVWFFSTSTLDLTEPATPREPEPREVQITASWIQVPGETGHHLTIDSQGSMLGIPYQITTGGSLMLAWDVGPLRLANTITSISPILRMVLRQLLLEALDQEHAKMPPIAVQRIARPLAVAHA